MEYKNEMPCSPRDGADATEKGGCFKECNFYTGVSLPVEIQPRAEVGEIDVQCCGDPEVRKEQSFGCVHKLTVTQNFFIKIPVCYRIKVTAGDCESDCNEKK